MYRSAKFALPVAASVMLATPASADPVTVQAVRSINVSYADIRLDTEDGQAELRTLVVHAAKQVCGFYEWPVEIAVVRHTCLKSVMRSADRQVAMATQHALARPAMTDADTRPMEIRLAVVR